MSTQHHIRLRGQYAAAETKFAEAVKLRAESLGEDNPETLQTMDSLALVMRHQAKYEAAENLAQQTLLKKEKLFGKEHANTLKTAHIVATLLRDRGTRPVLAVQQNRQILEARTKILGPDDLDRNFGVGAAGEPRDCPGVEARPSVRHIEPAIAGKAGKHGIAKAERGCLASGRDILHWPFPPTAPARSANLLT